MKLFSPCRVALVLVAAASVAGTAGGQTVGLPFLNDLFVDLGATGALAGPPGGAPCGAVPPTPIPVGATFALNVTTLSPGLFVLVFLDVGPACAPGIFPPPLCLPPVAGPYGAIPPVAGPCGPFTNQSFDLPPIPPVGPVVGFMGTSVAVPGGPGGLYTTGPIVNPGLGGLIVSVQAIIFDPLGGGASGMIVTNALDTVL